MKNQNIACESTEVLASTAKELLKDLRSKGYSVDCYSYRTDGKVNGIATEDCEIAIDFRGEGEYEHKHLMVIEENPYSVKENHSDYNLRRAKFVL